MKVTEQGFPKGLALGKWKTTCLRSSHIHQLHMSLLKSSFCMFGICQRIKRGKQKSSVFKGQSTHPRLFMACPLLKMFIWIYIFRWVLNAKTPFLMPIFHGDGWLHLLVFIWERTTKNLQLLQTRVTHTLSCVWLWCTSTFLVEEMKGRQAAESTMQDQLLWGAPTSRSLRCPSSFPKCWSLQCSPLWLGPRSQQAIKVVLCFTHSQNRAFP